MKDGDAVRINKPGDPCHGLIGNITMITPIGDIWVYLKEAEDNRKYAAKDLVAVRPIL